MARLTFDMLDVEAKKRDLILDREGKKYTVTDNSRGVEALCDTLAEAWSEIYHWEGKEAFK